MSKCIKVLACNGGCASCYENTIRAHQQPRPIDLGAILAEIKEGAEKRPAGGSGSGAPTVHGGEPLLLPVDALAHILGAIYDQYGYTSVQTNGTLLTDAHLAMFKRYKTSVGFSLDSDDPAANWGRWNLGDMAHCTEMTKLTVANIGRCREAGLRLSIITVLRKYNAGPKNLQALERFIERMEDDFGIDSFRFNEVIVYDPARRAEEELTEEQLGATFLWLEELCYSRPTRHWQPFRDVVDLLMGYGRATCCFSECDPWHTSGEQTIMADGSHGVCLKSGAALDGIQAPAADGYGRERYQLLASLDYAEGGCNGCRYWLLCRGGCPGAGIGNDWRNRTRFCRAYMDLFSRTEARLAGLIPNMVFPMELGVSGAPEAMLRSISGSSWQVCKRVNLDELVKLAKKNTPKVGYADVPYGDHWDSARGK